MFSSTNILMVEGDQSVFSSVFLVNTMDISISQLYQTSSEVSLKTEILGFYHEDNLLGKKHIILENRKRLEVNNFLCHGDTSTNSS